MSLISAFTFTVPAPAVSPRVFCPRPPGVSAPSLLSDCWLCSYPAKGFWSHCPDLFKTSLAMQEINVYSKQGKIWICYSGVPDCENQAATQGFFPWPSQNDLLTVSVVRIQDTPECFHCPQMPPSLSEPQHRVSVTPPLKVGFRNRLYHKHFWSIEPS